MVNYRRLSLLAAAVALGASLQVSARTVPSNVLLAGPVLSAAPIVLAGATPVVLLPAAGYLSVTAALAGVEHFGVELPMVSEAKYSRTEYEAAAIALGAAAGAHAFGAGMVLSAVSPALAVIPGAVGATHLHSYLSSLRKSAK